jgi:hypothetical protein
MPSKQWAYFEADCPSGWDEKAFSDFVERHEWTFARTMPQNPHEYTLRRNAVGADFDAAVRYIREHGRMEYFEGKPYKTLYLHESEYWTMGACLPDTGLLPVSLTPPSA